jgi:hypothetical protein
LKEIALVYTLRVNGTHELLLVQAGTNGYFLVHRVFLLGYVTADSRPHTPEICQVSSREKNKTPCFKGFYSVRLWIKGDVYIWCE